MLTIIILFLHLFARYNRQTSREAISPPRPCYLPISEPIPVPCQRNATVHQPSQSPSSNAARSGGSSVPRSQPISMKRSVDSHRSHPPDIGSLSPPSVQFVIGTPPGRRYIFSSKYFSLWIYFSFKIIKISNLPKHFFSQIVRSLINRINLTCQPLGWAKLRRHLIPGKSAPWRGIRTRPAEPHPCGVPRAITARPRRCSQVRWQCSARLLRARFRTTITLSDIRLSYHLAPGPLLSQRYLVNFLLLLPKSHISWNIISSRSRYLRNR